MKYYFFAFVLSALFINAQVRETYPKGQNFYKNGITNFYRDLQKVMLDYQLKPCENKNEIIYFKIIVYPDATIKYVKETDEEVLEKNKCAFDLIKNGVKHLKDWVPAEENGIKVPAIVNILFYPNDFFENFNEPYMPENKIVKSEFPGGINNFRNKFFQNYDVKGFNYSKDFKMTISFYIDRKGNAIVTNFDKQIENNNYLRMLIDAIEKMKTKWSPASYKGLPIESFYKFPIGVNNL